MVISFASFGFAVIEKVIGFAVIEKVIGFAVIGKVIYFMSLASPSLEKVIVSLKIFVFRS